MFKRILKQTRVPGLGELVDSLFSTLPIISIYSGVSVTIILYAQIKDNLLNVFPWMTLWCFVLIIGVGIIPLMLLVYKFVIPSIWNFRSKQMSHLEKKVDLIMQKLNIGIKDEENQ